MKSKTKIKFCGLTKEQDVQAAINLNINLVGFIYVKNTPRYINFKNSKKIIDKFKNQVSFVGVFLDNSNEFIEQGVKVGINFIQLHGSESPSRCREIKKEFKLPIIKSIPIFEEKDLFIIKEYSDDIDMFLFDTKSVSAKKYNGGTGLSFDWNIIKENKKWIDKLKPWILSGGLNPNNINDALNTTDAKFIDVSSGIEYSLGKKSHNLMNQFAFKVKNIE